MKIKKWLIISYLVVMVLPAATAYLFYILLQSYDTSHSFQDLLTVDGEIRRMENILDDPQWYVQKANDQNGNHQTGLQPVAQLTSPSIAITLFSKDGVILYASQPLYQDNRIVSQEVLYQNLYQMQSGYRAYQYKRPVFQNHEIVGLFEIMIAKEAWLQEVSNTGMHTLVYFVLASMITFIVVLKLLDNKLRKPLRRLMQQMDSFARGEEAEYIKINNDEIGQLIRHFTAMRAQIESSKKEVARQQAEKVFMMASISHDLKTPLTVIKALAESYAETIDASEQQTESLRVIMKKSEYMEQMINDLTTFSLLSTETQDIDTVTVDGEEFFEMLLSGYEEICRKQNVLLHVECRVHGQVEVNPKQLIRVMDNLVNNAIRYTPVGKRLCLAALSVPCELPDWILESFARNVAGWKEGGVFLLVQNDGKGVPEAEREKLFEPLFQGDPARSKDDDQGSGLGLSIAKMIIEKHKGKIAIFSEESEGTLVACWLPSESRNERAAL